MVLAATKSAEGQDPAALEIAKPHETADGEKEHITTGKKGNREEREENTSYAWFPKPHADSL